MKLTDQSQMPFGKHHGKTMERVPADYLLWLWDEGNLWDKRLIALGPGREIRTDQRAAVRDYIIENFSALETECKDRIIQHRP